MIERIERNRSIQANRIDTAIISIKEFKTSGDSVSAAVYIQPQDATVDEELAIEILALRPRLAEHACKQKGFGSFGDKLVGTTLPHLVEHVSIDLLVEKAEKQGSQSTLHLPIAGNTRWLDRQSGIMNIMISCTAESSETTCAAITRAIALVNRLLEL